MQLSFKLILSWTWRMMSLCLTIYIFHVYKLRSIFTKILHVKIWINNLDGFHVQIILSSVGEREYWGYNRMELEHSRRTIWILSSNISHRRKSKSKYTLSFTGHYPTQRESGGTYGLILCLGYIRSQYQNENQSKYLFCLISAWLQTEILVVIQFMQVTSYQEYTHQYKAAGNLE